MQLLPRHSAGGTFQMEPSVLHRGMPAPSPHIATRSSLPARPGGPQQDAALPGAGLHWPTAVPAQLAGIPYTGIPYRGITSKAWSLAEAHPGRPAGQRAHACRAEFERAWIPPTRSAWHAAPHCALQTLAPTPAPANVSAGQLALAHD